jgi:hypothetical protein
VVKICSRFDRISFAIHLRASEFQARDTAETVAFDGVADVEVVDSAGVKVEMGPGNWAAKPPSTASAELISEKEIVRANVPNKSRGLCFSLCTAILFLWIALPRIFVLRRQTFDRYPEPLRGFLSIIKDADVDW